MESAMKTLERKKRLREIESEMTVSNRQGDLSRARSITVGTCNGGVTEIMMRGNNQYMWMIMHPVEVIELIHQLAANVGCHIHIQPRKDFASWRNWQCTDEELAHYRNGGGALINKGSGHAPHVNDIAPFVSIGKQPAIAVSKPSNKPAFAVRSEKNEQTLATQETVRRKRTKRAAAAT
jgi:hypothetical protein